MAVLRFEQVHLVVPFLDGRTLLAWKAAGRLESALMVGSIGEWLLERAKRIDRLAKHFLGVSPARLRERSFSLSHDEASDSELSHDEASDSEL